MAHHHLFAATIIVSTSSTSLAQSLPDGWGPYHFGMTVEQVRAVPHTSWGELEKLSRAYYFKSGATVLMNGRPAELTMYFGLAGLVEIALKGSAPGTQCEAAFQRDLRLLEQRYGNFSPTIDKLGQGSGYRDEFRNLSRGKSRYVVTLVQNDHSQQFEAGRMEAKRDQADRSVKFATWDDKGACNFTLDLRDKLYE